MSVMSACRDISELHLAAQSACKLFLEECKKAGLDIFITETYRSQERQDYLYAQGRTRPGPVVTWTRNSNHKSRLAWDIACNKPSLYDTDTLNKAGKIALGLGIGWGGTWEKVDRPHFEVKTNWVAPKKEEVKVDKSIKLSDNQKADKALLAKHGYMAANFEVKSGEMVALITIMAGIVKDLESKGVL